MDENGLGCPETSGVAENTDTHLWPIVSEEQWPDRLHITAQGALGINCGGCVRVKTIRAWHEQDKRIAELEAAILSIRNDTLEGAARAAEKYGDDADGHDYDYVIDDTCIRVASAIRAMKEG
ncbi:MAG: hypothetical protein AB7U76_25000 [Pirellulales bacterium]